MIHTPNIDGLLAAFAFVASSTGGVSAVRMVFKCLLCAHTLLDHLPASRPLVYLIGPPGCGKTTLARLAGKIISGPEWDVTGLPPQERDFWPIIGTLNPTVLDNVEAPRPWAMDALAKATSGAGQRARKLYSDTITVVHKACSFIWLTSYSGGVLRGDLLDRSLIFRLTRPEQRLTEAWMLRKVTELRPEFMRELSTVTEAVGAFVRDHGAISISDCQERLADFVSVGRTVAFVTEGEAGVALFNTGMETMRGARVTLARNDPEIDVLIGWAQSPDNRDTAGNPGMWVTARDLLARVADGLGADGGFDGTARNAASFGRFLMDLKVKASAILNIDCRTINGCRLYRVTLASVQQ